MEVPEILSEMQERGLRATVRAGVLMIGPCALMTDDLRAVVQENMADLLAYFAVAGDADLQWRVARMLEQLLPIRWPCPVPCLFAAPDGQPNKEDCASCAELLDIEKGDSFCCGACSRAKHIALDLWMQRPASQTVRAA